MHRNFLALVLAFAFVSLAALPATADPGIALLSQSVGQRVRYRFVRNTQGRNGPQSTTAVFDLVRRAGTTMVIERGDVAGTPNLSVLKTGADGSLALAEDPRGAAAVGTATPAAERHRATTAVCQLSFMSRGMPAAGK